MRQIVDGISVKELVELIDDLSEFVVRDKESDIIFDSTTGTYRSFTGVVDYAVKAFWAEGDNVINIKVDTSTIIC